MKWTSNIKGYRAYKADGTEIEEPFVILRGKDVFALDAMEHYRNTVSRFHPDPTFVASISEMVERIRIWRVHNQDTVKIPD